MVFGLGWVGLEKGAKQPHVGQPQIRSHDSKRSTCTLVVMESVLDPVGMDHNGFGTVPSDFPGFWCPFFWAPKQPIWAISSSEVASHQSPCGFWGPNLMGMMVLRRVPTACAWGLSRLFYLRYGVLVRLLLLLLAACLLLLLLVLVLKNGAHTQFISTRLLTAAKAAQ